MKKLLLLSLLVLFGCSKEDSGVDSANQALIASLNAQVSALNAQISAMNSEISALQSQVAENSSLESQINDVISQLNEAQDALEESNSLLSQKTLDLDDAQNTIIGLVDIIDNLNREFALIELSIVLWIQRAAGFYEFEYYENNVYVGTFSWEIGLTENNDIIWNSYYLSGNCFVRNSNASFGDDVQFYFTAVSFDDLGIGAYNVDGETVGLPDYDKVILVESYTIDISGGLEVMLSAYDMDQNLIRTIVNDGSSLEKKTKSQLVYDFCSNNGVSGSTNNQDSSDYSENQETSNNGSGSSTDNSSSTDNTENQETSGSESNNSDSSSTDNQSDVSDNPYIYLDSNGVTVKANPLAEVGELGLINGVVYEVVDENKLREMISNDQDITKVVTSKIYNMKELFYYNYDFNQDISSWDVSNVNSMERMFTDSNFNQDISNWDVSGVYNMKHMFYSTPFNQDISSWEVSNVFYFDSMFTSTPFNQDISSWDISNALSLKLMFSGSDFNQDISSWDTANVKNMSNLFSSSSFNQDISSWDTSNVNLMEGMFQNSDFNQDISSWDTSEVTKMRRMFFGTTFNQDLSSWNVIKVTDCRFFNSSNPNWSLPKPNFTNCDPS